MILYYWECLISKSHSQTISYWNWWKLWSSFPLLKRYICITRQIRLHAYSFAALSKKLSRKQSTTCQASSSNGKQQVVKFYRCIFKNFLCTSGLSFYDIVVIERRNLKSIIFFLYFLTFFHSLFLSIPRSHNCSSIPFCRFNFYVRRVLWHYYVSF